MDLKEEEILGGQVGSHWYYKSKADFMRAYLSRGSYEHVLDVGAGSGYFARHLLERAIAHRATCVDTGYERDWTESVDGRVLRHVRSASPEGADLVLFMDVLEHVADDVGLLRQYTQSIPANGEVFVSVPAFAFLWSGHDEFLGHYRRYTVMRLRHVIEAAGLEMTRCSYGFGAVFPIAAIRRSWMRWRGERPEGESDLRPHSPPVNAVLSFLCALERPFIRHNRLAGLSVFCLAHKPGQS